MTDEEVRAVMQANIWAGQLPRKQFEHVLALTAPLHKRIEAQAAEIERLERSRSAWEDEARRYAGNSEYWQTETERLREALEIWIFHHQRAMGEKPDVARQYAKAWMFRNANGEEPE